MKKVVVITGPTGIGKTSIAVEVAKTFNAQVISADSAQVYRGLNIGTAKITEAEKKGVIHHLIDIVEPTDLYDVASYQHDARNLIEIIDRPFIVGGTGLYIKATIDDYDFSGKPRDYEFEQQFKALTNEELHERLQKQNLAASLKIHPNNRRRVLKALNEEIPSKKAKDNPVYNYLIIELIMDRSDLYQRINQRVVEMMDIGLLEEVKALKAKGLTFNIICYKQLNDYLDGKTSLDEAVKEIQKVTRRYAKRQQTWFKNQMKTVKVAASDKDKATKEIIEIVNGFYKL